MAPKKRKTKKSKKRRRRSSKLPAKKLHIPPGEIKETRNPRSLLQWFLLKKVSISVGTALALLTLYITYYPKKLQIEDQLIGKFEPFGNAIIIKNPNEYKVSSINFWFQVKASFTLKNGYNIKNHQFEGRDFFRFLDAKKSTHFDPKWTLTASSVDKIYESEVTIVISYKTPFLYPDIEKDTVSYIGRLNTDNEVLYLPK